MEQVYIAWHEIRSLVAGDYDKRIGIYKSHSLARNAIFNEIENNGGKFTEKETDYFVSNEDPGSKYFIETAEVIS